MPLMSSETLSGYLLEEALCQLLRQNGYKLLRRETEDPDALRDSGRGLLVRGRGAEHQADALGDLLLPSPFSLPIRLFVEAKNRGTKAQLRDVRNAQGVITDVNEHYSISVALSYRQPLRRFLYRYALFSTSGFTSEAQGFALAHQISLIDLSGPAFSQLAGAVTDATQEVHSQAVALGLKSFPLHQVRHRLRLALERVEEDIRSPGWSDYDEISAADRSGNNATHQEFETFVDGWAARFTAALHNSLAGEGLLIGFPPAPFILAMRPDSMAELEDYVANHGTDIAVRIGFDRDSGVAGDWTITPRDEPDAFRLSFGLPGALETWLLAGPDGGAHRAAEAKQDLLSTITMFLEDRMVQLRFSPARPPARPPEERNAEATDASDRSWLREELRAPTSTKRHGVPHPTLSVVPEPVPHAPVGSGWRDRATEQLMSQLDDGSYVQGPLIREAARRGGSISRADVYQVAGFPRNRTLRGLTRPTNRITATLITSGFVPEDAEYPFQARYEGGVRASHFVVPLDLVAALRRLEEDTGI
jgi:hypothetical protein